MLPYTSISIGFSSFANDFIASRIGRKPKHTIAIFNNSIFHNYDN